MLQQDLFRAPSVSRTPRVMAAPPDSGGPGLPPPRAHRRDARSSHEAARDAMRWQATHANIVLQGVKAYPCSTSAELAQMLGMGLYAVRRRLTDLLEAGAVRQFESANPCAISSKRVLRWDVAS